MDASQVLASLQDRVNTIKQHVTSIEQQLASLDCDQTKCANSINETCDGMVESIETYRRLLLQHAQTLKERKHQILQERLTTLSKLYCVLTSTNRQSQEFIAQHHQNWNDNATAYQLIGLNQIINAGRMEEALLQLDTAQSTASPTAITDGYAANVHLESVSHTLRRSQFSSMLTDTFSVTDAFPPETIADKQIIVEIPEKLQHDVVLVHWFRINNVNQVRDFPKEVRNIVTRFSSPSFNDRFDCMMKNEYIEITNNGLMASGPTSGDYVESVFGTAIAESGCVYEWKIAVHSDEMEADESWCTDIWINIGVIDSNKCEEFRNKAWWLTNDGYSYFSDDGNFYHRDRATFGGRKHYGERYHAGDVIAMQLDLRDNKIRFARNGKQYSFQNVDDEKSYCLAIGMHCYGTSVSLSRRVEILSSVIIANA